MARGNHDRNKDLIRDVSEAAGRIRKGDGEALDFILLLFARGIHEDLAQYRREDLARVALAAWDLLGERTPGEAKIRISNPDITVASEHGWQAPVTVIEIANDNMPFLVDSVMGELQERGLTVYLALHPILTVPRSKSGKRTGPVSATPPAGSPKGACRESYIHIHVDRIDRDSARGDLKDALQSVLEDNRRAVVDWPAMVSRLEATIANFHNNPPPIPVDEVAEGIHFLKWLADNNFTLLGMREYAFDTKSATGGLERVAESGLGILRDPDVKVLRRGRELVTFTPELREFLMQPVPLIVTKANVRSRVHRRAHMDYIGVKLFDADGNVTGELRIVGLFTATAYTRSARSIPFLRRKVDHVLRAAGYDPDGHSGKALINVLENYPRDELFQIDLDTLTDFSLVILQLGEHPRLRVLARPDKFDRFVSVLVYVPRDRFSTASRTRVGDYLARVYDGRVSAFYPTFLEGALVRVHYIIGRYEGETPNISQVQLEAEIGKLVRTWSDNVHAELARDGLKASAQNLHNVYLDAFPGSYQERFAATDAVGDIAVMESLSQADALAIRFLHHDADKEAASRVGLKLFHQGAPIPLSSRVPILENMGFRVIDERSYSVAPSGRETIWLHDMDLETADGREVDLNLSGAALEACFSAVWTGEAEDDGYNGLVLRSGLAWRDVMVLRAYSRYLRQARIPFSQDYMWGTLNRHAGIAADLFRLFATRFDPALEGSMDERKAHCDTIVARVEEALQAVDSLDEDRIIRRFVNLILATQRSSVYQLDSHGAHKPTMAFKIRSRAVDELPRPRPYAEISVYSPQVEGVHLRFGKVARGGLRWSDRPQDFRTEVLGLVKAQQVKNAVIVPVGSKGGFVPKHLPAGGTRDEIQAEGVAAYKIFVSSLLDLTDNLDGDRLVEPRRVVRHDDDDPYLVVAADKGTATFSDIANGISESRHFWLGDAFASGGSAGYDHKKMAITARGGWEAVKRHFREMDIDIQTTPFSVIGVGDMSGDVFGNGMLLSPQIRLIAAFDHRDIFIDPAPDPAVSLAERQRLFDLPRSSWADYDAQLISAGGGVFSRKEKSIPLSPQMQAITGLDKERATPFEIIRGLLQAEADLLWFGGIGTYVRASTQSDEDVGDRANDAVRVTAADLRVKVIGEGANLGMTQKARIEFAQAGGRINTDAIDNSAGVNSSDLEVNIKIALGFVVRAGELTLPDRNRLLVEMTGEVAGLVLRNNYLQTLALSLTERRGLEDFSFQVRFMRDLEARGLLDRAVEDLPDDAELTRREKQGEPLTRPELAVLLAYAKITLFDQLLASAVPDDAYLGKELMRYFPAALQERYGEAISNHRLRREIIATMLANSMINRGGPTLISRLIDQTGADVPEIAAAFAVVRDSFSMTALNTDIDGLDNTIPGALQLELHESVQNLLLEQLVWFLRNVAFDEGLAGVIERYRSGVESLFGEIADVVPADARARLDRRIGTLVEAGVPQPLAQRIAALGLLAMAPDIVLVAQRTDRPVPEVAKAFFALSAYFDTGAIVAAARALSISDYFDRLALNSALENLADAQRLLTAQVLAGGASGAEGLERWVDGHRADAERTRRALGEIAGDGGLTLSKVAVAASLLKDLVRG